MHMVGDKRLRISFVFHKNYVLNFDFLNCVHKLCFSIGNSITDNSIWLLQLVLICGKEICCCYTIKY